MKAFVTSIGERTTELCVWSLERNGFEVELVQNGSLLVDKLKTIYEKAEDDFVRVDADVVVNKQFTPKLIEMCAESDDWWIQFQTYDWLKQDVSWGGVQFIKKRALPYLRESVDEYHNQDRPETQLSRIKAFYEPRRFKSVPVTVGLHSYAVTDIDRVYNQKKKRNYFETYDFELAKKLVGLL